MLISSEIPDHLYRNGVGMLIINGAKKIFVGKRLRNRSNFWQMPQGGIVGDEDEITALRREIREETGIRHYSILTESRGYYYYNLPYQLQKKFWNGRYLGQKQRWFLVSYFGDPEEINLGLHRPEFSQYDWVSPVDLIKNVVSFKKTMYADIVNEFREYLQ